MCSIAKRSSISGVSTRSSSFTFCLVPSDSMRSVSSRISAAIRVIVFVLCLQITTLPWVAALQRFFQVPDRHVRMDLRCRHRGVAEQFLDVPQLGPAFQQVRWAATARQ